MRKQFLGVMLLCGALLVGCSQGNSLQDQVESLTGETQVTIEETERFEAFENVALYLLDNVKSFSYEENIIVIDVECGYIIENDGIVKGYTREEDIKFGYDMSRPLSEYEFGREFLGMYNLQDVKLIVEITKNDEVIGYYDGTTWEEAK